MHAHAHTQTHSPQTHSPHTHTYTNTHTCAHQGVSTRRSMLTMRCQTDGYSEVLASDEREKREVGTLLDQFDSLSVFTPCTPADRCVRRAAEPPDAQERDPRAVQTGVLHNWKPRLPPSTTHPPSLSPRSLTLHVPQSVPRADLNEKTTS